MSSSEIAEIALRLTGESATKLERWMRLFDETFQEHESRGTAPDLKELAAFLACVKRSLEIARIAQALNQSKGELHEAGLDLEGLRRVLFEED